MSLLRFQRIKLVLLQAEQEELTVSLQQQQEQLRAIAQKEGKEKQRALQEVARLKRELQASNQSNSELKAKVDVLKAVGTEIYKIAVLIGAITQRLNDKILDAKNDMIESLEKQLTAVNQAKHTAQDRMMKMGGQCFSYASL